MSAAECASKASMAEQAQGVSGASEWANGRASGPVLQTVFLIILAHSGRAFSAQKQEQKRNKNKNARKTMA